MGGGGGGGGRPIDQMSCGPGDAHDSLAFDNEIQEGRGHIDITFRVLPLPLG